MSSISLVKLLLSVCLRVMFFFFFFNDTATTEIYTLSLHDALPISVHHSRPSNHSETSDGFRVDHAGLQHALHILHCPADSRDRKSTRLNSSHSQISYAVFCLKKKKTHTDYTSTSARCR